MADSTVLQQVIEYSSNLHHNTACGQGKGLVAAPLEKEK